MNRPPFAGGGRAIGGHRSVSKRHRALVLGALAVALAGGIAWGLARVFEERRFSETLAQARLDARRGRFEAARKAIAALPAWQLADPEAADLLATAEHAAGHYEAAVLAWSRIPDDAPNAGPVALARARTLVGNLGRFAEAEAVLEAAFRRAGPARLEIAHTLSQLYFFESRPDAMRRLIRETRPDWRDPSAELRDLWLIDDATVLVDEVRRAVDAAASQAPGDDRVRLAEAGLAILSGQFAEAGRRLDDCLRARPGDPAAWLASLRLARASADAEAARKALAHLPADALLESEALDLRAWLAERRGDVDDRRRTLERRVEVGPTDPGAFEALAALAWEAGRKDDAAALRRRKAELDALKDRYRRLLADRVPADQLEEIATLAGSLGRRFEAEGWWSLLRRLRPDDPKVAAGLDRARALREEPVSPRGSLADRLAGLLSGGPARPEGPVKPGLVASGKPSARFVDDAERAGLSFALENGRSPQRQLPETTAGGVGLVDYDGDGWLDVYAIQGGTFPPDSSRPNDGDRLFRNKRDGTFEDATASSGIAGMPRGYGHGIAVGDFDNDGDPDLFVTRWRSYALYRNRGDGTFEDATEAAGLGGDRDWPTSAAFADLDNDGDLDLYVCHYVAWDAEHPRICPVANPPAGAPARNGYCMPHGLVASPDHLFRNDAGRFVDATAEAGIVDRDGRGLGVVAADVDDDGRVDLFVANDTTANYLFMNRGGLRFEESGLVAGVACNAEGAYQAGMGTACGDLDGDGKLDLLVTNFYGESTTFYRNLGGGIFGDATARIGLQAPSRYLLGFGIVPLDANNDGRLDLAIANGHVNDERPRFPYAMPAQLLLGSAGGRLVDIGPEAGPPWEVPRVARGLAAGDLDNDGRVDLVLIAQDGPLAYFHNQSRAGRSLTVRLEGTGSNRDGVGARVVATAGGRRQVAARVGGGSFQSASDPRIHLGLGDADRVEELEVRWPSGRVDRHRGLPADGRLLIREAEAAPATLTERSGPGR